MQHLTYLSWNLKLFQFVFVFQNFVQFTIMTIDFTISFCWQGLLMASSKLHDLVVHFDSNIRVIGNVDSDKYSFLELTNDLYSIKYNYLSITSKFRRAYGVKERMLLLYNCSTCTKCWGCPIGCEMSWWSNYKCKGKFHLLS